MSVRTALQLGAFVVAWCFCLELLVRLLLVSPNNTEPDPRLGFTYAPNTTALIESSDAGFVRVQLNELGLNDTRIDSRGRRKRIVVLGDSYVEAFQVPRADNFVRVLSRDEPDFQFVNGGQSGLDPTTELAMLTRLAPKIAPDGVILVVNVGDQADLLADHITLVRCASSAAICDFREPPHPDQSHQAQLIRALSRHSALITYLARRFRDPFIAEVEFVKSWVANPSGLPVRRPRKNEYVGNDFPDLLSLVFRRIATKFPLVVVAVPGIDFEADGKSRSDDGGAFERKVEAAARSAGAGYFDLGPALAAAYSRDHQPPRGFDFSTPGFGHLNGAGHLALAHGLEHQLSIFDRKPSR